MFEHLVVLSPQKQAILKVQISTGVVSELVSGVDAFPDGVVIDRAHQHVYWTNMGTPTLKKGHSLHSDSDLDFYHRNGSLERVGLDGRDRRILLPEGSFVTGKQLAAAWSAGRLYWADREGAAIRSARLDGSDLRDEVIVAIAHEQRHHDRNHCVGIAIDEVNGHLYWTQKGPPKGDDGRILRTSLRRGTHNPASRRIEVLWSGLPEPVDLEIDRKNAALYWTDRGAPPRGNTLNRAAIPPEGHAGGEVFVLSTNFHEAIGLAIDHSAQIAYVSDLAGEIRAVSLDGTGERTLLTIDANLTGIAGS